MEIRRMIYKSDQVVFLPFVAPTIFDPDAQNINIFNIYNEYINVNKAYIYSFIDTLNTLSLPVISGISYRVGYTRGGVDIVLDGANFTNPFIAGDEKRYVIVNSINVNLIISIPIGGVWVASGIKVVSISSQNNGYLKYIHYSSDGVNTGISGFAYCYILSGLLSIPLTIVNINNSSFAYCSSITGVLKIPSAVRLIGSYSFIGDTGFTSLELESDNIIFGENPFVLTNIILTDKLGVNYEVNNKIIYGDILRNKIIGATKNKTGSLIIESSVNHIGVNAFRGCTGINDTLTLPNSVSFIGGGAFRQCSFTGGLVIPTLITIIKEVAFDGCKFFNGDLSIHANITSIETGAFGGCIAFTSLSLGSGYNPVQAKDNWLFNFSNNFTAISLNQSILNIAGGGNTTRTITIGATNKARLLAAYPNAEIDANARGITII